MLQENKIKTKTFKFLIFHLNKKIAEEPQNLCGREKTYYTPLIEQC